MPLLDGETWDDYINKEVYVTSTYGMSGFTAVLLHYDFRNVWVEDNNGNEHKLKHEDVYGTWILEDW